MGFLSHVLAYKTLTCFDSSLWATNFGSTFQSRLTSHPGEANKKGGGHRDHHSDYCLLSLAMLQALHYLIQPHTTRQGHHYVNFINEKTELRRFLSDSKQEAEETLKLGNLGTFNEGTNYKRVDKKHDLENSTKYGIIPWGKQQWGAVFTFTSEDTRREWSRSPGSCYTERVVGQRWWP